MGGHAAETARVHGLAVTGSTGEGHALTTDEVWGITAAVVDEARARVPVITGIITDSTGSAVERGLAVRDLGVAALQVTPVHYLFRPDDDAMVRHFDTLARRPACRSSSTTWCRGPISRRSSWPGSSRRCPG